METRICSICGEEKPLSKFGVHHKPGSRKGDPYRKYCKECQAKRAREWRADPAHKKSLKKTYQNGYSRVRHWKKTNYNDPTENSARYRKWWLKSIYGLTPENYQAILKRQNGCCAICGATRGNGRTKHLAVDHDHGTGAIRGLLCIRCNQAIGSFDDDISLLRKAADYLEYFH